VAGHARILKTRQVAFDSHRIAVTNAAGMNPNQKLFNARRGNLAFDSFEPAARSGHLHCNHHDRSFLIWRGIVSDEADPAAWGAAGRAVSNVASSRFAVSSLVVSPPYTVRKPF
jgi:hypothetical protein